MRVSCGFFVTILEGKIDIQIFDSLRKFNLKYFRTDSISLELILPASSENNDCDPKLKLLFDVLFIFIFFLINIDLNLYCFGNNNINSYNFIVISLIRLVLNQQLFD